MVPYTRIVVMEVVRGGQTLDIFWKWSPRNYIWCIEFGVWNKEQSQHLFQGFDLRNWKGGVSI